MTDNFVDFFTCEELHPIWNFFLKKTSEIATWHPHRSKPIQLACKKTTNPGNPAGDLGLKVGYEIFPNLQQQILFACFSQVSVQLQNESNSRTMGLNEVWKCTIADNFAQVFRKRFSDLSLPVRYSKFAKINALKSIRVLLLPNAGAKDLCKEVSCMQKTAFWVEDVWCCLRQDLCLKQLITAEACKGV